MDRAWAEALQGFDVLLRAVAFITGEAVLRVHRVVLLHEVIPRDLREDAGGGDGDGLRVALDDRFLRDVDARDRDGVVQQEARGVGEAFRPEHVARLLKCDAHRFIIGLEDIDLIDALLLHDTDAVGDGLFFDFRQHRFAAKCGHFLRIVEVEDHGILREDAAGGHDRAGQRPSAGFVDAGDEANIDVCVFIFVHRC